MKESSYLCGDACTIADLALAPFVRQFANTNRAWFDDLDLPNLHAWLSKMLEDELFRNCMVKHPQWKPGDEPIMFG